VTSSKAVLPTLLFINDIEHMCCGDTNLQLFADDCKLYSPVTINCVSISLQQAVDNLANWANNWQLSINISKYVVLQIGSKRGAASSCYVINMKLIHTDLITDLGVEVDSDLSYHAHIVSIAGKVTKRAGIIFRSFVIRDLKLMRKAFITYIHSLLSIIQ
jgi:hypothetical protein